MERMGVSGRVNIAHVIYRYESGSWWIDSPEHPGYTAVGSSRVEVTELARSGLPFFAGSALEITGLDPPQGFTRSNGGASAKMVWP